MQRKLAAILAADVVGYSHLMEADEAGTLACQAVSYNFPFRWEREYATVRERLIDGLRVAGLPLNTTVSTFVAELKSDDPFRRQITAKRLGWFGKAAAPAVPALIGTLQDEVQRRRFVGGVMKSSVGNVVKAFGLVAVGIFLATAGIYIGETDDAPGAALIGILLMIGAVALGVRIARRKPSANNGGTLQ